MSERIYVTVADTKHMDTRVVYAGMDKSEAFDVLDEHTQTSVSLTRLTHQVSVRLRQFVVMAPK